MPFLRRKRACRAPKRAPWYLFVLERLIHQGIKLSVLAFVVAWLLARSSTSTIVNLPVAVVIVIAIRWLSLRLVVDTGSARGSSRSSRRLDRYMGPQMYYREKTNVAGDIDNGTTHSDRDAWKKIVNAPIVASAWESLCGSILQEWVYDAWFSLITPDREFPAAIRRLINEIFAEVAQRAKRMDLRNVLIRDMCDLFTEHLELYRATKEGVGILNEGDLRPSSRDRAFQQEMKTEGTLHVAFCTRDGHYKVIKRICEGIISITMSKEDLARPYTRVLARELLATCLIRPILMYFSPYTANKLILNALPDPERLQARERSQEDSKAENQNGHFQFEQRVRKSAALEERAAIRTMDKAGAQKPGQGSSSVQDIYLQHQSRQQALDACSADDTLGANEIGPRVRKMSCTEQNPVEMNTLVAGDDPASRNTSVSTQVPGNPDDIQRQASLPTSTPQAFGSIALEAASFNQPGAPSTRSETSQCMDSDYTPLRNATLSNVSEISPSTEDCIRFKGHPRARVVVHEVMYDSSNRRYVVFKIRVGDDTGEWTVARRYRNFEALHRVLRDHPVYQDLLLKLPPKSFFRHSQNTEFVEGRRVALDRYLQTLLSSRMLASNSDVGAFLMDQEHAVYRHSLDAGLFRTLTDNVDNAKHRMKCAVVSRSRRNRVRGTSCEENDSQTSQSFPTPRQLDNPDDPIFGSLRLTHASRDKIKYTHPDYSSQKVASVESGIGQPHMAAPHSSPHTPRNYIHRQHTQCGVQSPLTDSASIVSSRPDSPGKYSSRFDAKSVSMCDTRSQGGSSDTPIRGAGTRDDIGREAFAWNSLPVLESEDTWPDWDTEFEDYSGISGPLYEVVESIFALPAQKFFRRQVLHTVRQLLSLLAGDSIDLFLLEKIKSLRTEHTLARIIHMLQNSLWPGGKWFSSVPPHSTAMAEYQRENPGAKRAMTRERYLEPLLGHKDADELAGKVYARFLEQPPAALIRIVGKQCYSSGMQDVYDMLQLPTFMTQMGYGVLEIVLLALFPELRDVFVRIHRETAHKKES